MSMLLLLLSCQSAMDTATECDQVTTWHNFGESFFLTWCSSCHAQSTEDRHGAPEGVFLDTEADSRLWQDRIRVRVIEEESMPVGGGISTSELELLERYLDGFTCGEDL